MPRGPQFKKLLIDKNLPDPGADLEEYYYTTKELSGLLNISPGSLSGYRRAGIGPKYILFGYRTCRYAKADVVAYMEERARMSTSEQWSDQTPKKPSCGFLLMNRKEQSPCH